MASTHRGVRRVRLGPPLPGALAQLGHPPLDLREVHRVRARLQRLGDLERLARFLAELGHPRGLSLEVSVGGFGLGDRTHLGFSRPRHLPIVEAIDRCDQLPRAIERAGGASLTRLRRVQHALALGELGPGFVEEPLALPLPCLRADPAGPLVSRSEHEAPVLETTGGVRRLRLTRDGVGDRRPDRARGLLVRVDELRHPLGPGHVSDPREHPHPWCRALDQAARSRAVGGGDHEGRQALQPDEALQGAQAVLAGAASWLELCVEGLRVDPFATERLACFGESREGQLGLCPRVQCVDPRRGGGHRGRGLGPAVAGRSARHLALLRPLRELFAHRFSPSHTLRSLLDERAGLRQGTGEIDRLRQRSTGPIRPRLEQSSTLGGRLPRGDNPLVCFPLGDSPLDLRAFGSLRAFLLIAARAPELATEVLFVCRLCVSKSALGSLTAFGDSRRFRSGLFQREREPLDALRAPCDRRGIRFTLPIDDEERIARELLPSRPHVRQERGDRVDVHLLRLDGA